MKPIKKLPAVAVLLSFVILTGLVPMTALADPDEVVGPANRPGTPFRYTSSLLDQVGTARAITILDKDDLEPGEMLVIEQISYSVEVPAGQAARVGIVVQGPGGLGRSNFRWVPGFTHDGKTVVSDTVAVRQYLFNDPDSPFTSDLIVSFSRNSAVGQWDGTISISGYLVPLGTFPN